LKLKNKKGPGVLEERQAIDDEMARWFVDALSDKQRVRLRQIDLQWEGASALCRMSVAGYLDMSEQQRSTVERLLAEREKRRPKGLLAPGDLETFSRQMLSVLTPSQRVHWDGLLGPPCRFAIEHPAAAPRSRAGDPGLTGQPQPPTR
jgi:hypothetical protein